MTHTNSKKEELRKKIKQAQFNLAGRRATHIQVGRKSGWTVAELDGVHEGDQIIFENDIIGLLTQALKELKEEATLIETNDKWGGTNVEPKRAVTIEVIDQKIKELESKS